MIYRNYREIENFKPGTKLWACAYQFDNNKTTMGLISKPVYGMLRGYAWDYEEIAEEESYSSFFVPFKKIAKQNLQNQKQFKLIQECMLIHMRNV